jgi:hypothetical protein
MVKFYHIIGFTQPALWGGEPVAGHYMGKTGDLVFKTEPDKTIDLDDGSTEVGSEKLSLSFSCLEKLQNSWPLAELWLVPVCQNYYMDNPEILRIDLRGCDYHLDAKSGDFEKILFSAVLRYPVANPPYSSLTDYFDSYSIVLGRLSGYRNGDVVEIRYDDGPVASLDVEMMLIDGCFAFVGIDPSIDPSAVAFGMDEMDIYGLFGLNWFAPDGN